MSTHSALQSSPVISVLMIQGEESSCRKFGFKSPSSCSLLWLQKILEATCHLIANSCLALVSVLELGSSQPPTLPAGLGGELRGEVRGAFLQQGCSLKAAVSEKEA